MNKKISSKAHERNVEAFDAEMADRSGKLPIEVEHRSLPSKLSAGAANVERFEAGPKGAVVAFRDNMFANPDRLVAFIRQQGVQARVRTIPGSPALTPL